MFAFLKVVSKVNKYHAVFIGSLFSATRETSLHWMVTGSRVRLPRNLVLLTMMKMNLHVPPYEDWKAFMSYIMYSLIQTNSP